MLSFPLSLPLEFAATTVDKVLITGSFLLVGFAVEETTAAAAANFYFRDGENAATAPMRYPVRLAMNESRGESIPGMGIVFERALLLDMIAGSVAGVVFVVPTEHFRIEGGIVVVGHSIPGYSEEIGVLL